MKTSERLEKKLLNEYHPSDEDITTPKTKIYDFRIGSSSNYVKAENIKQAFHKIVDLYNPKDDSFRIDIYVKKRN